MLVTYVLSLAMVFVMALIIDALAPTFGGQKDQTQALRTVAYAYTASWVAGFAHVLPGLGMALIVAGAIYSIYLLYLGLPHTMKCPPEKSAGYTAVAIIVAIALNIAVGLVVGVVAGVNSGLQSSTYATDSAVTSGTDSPLGKLEQWSKSVEEAGKQLEAAEKSGNKQAQSDAMKDLMGAALGGGDVEALAPDRLRSFLPEMLAGMSRSEVSAERNGAMGMQISQAQATYSDADGHSLKLEITDTGSAKGLLGLAGWAEMEGEQQNSEGYDKTYRQDGRLVHEKWDRSGGEYSVVLGDRFMVEISGKAGSMDDLKAALGQVDMRALEALRDEGVQAN